MAENHAVLIFLCKKGKGTLEKSRKNGSGMEKGDGFAVFYEVKVKSLQNENQICIM